MVNKHFLKTLVVFTGIIALGLLGVFLVSYFDSTSKADNTRVPVAE